MIVMSELALRLSDISKRFGDFQAVDRLSLQLPRGQVMGFLGPNGAGKTTTLRMIMGIIHPDGGSIEILGSADAMAAKDRVGYLPEERGLYRKMTVIDTLRYFGKLKGLGGRSLSERIDESLARVELLDWKRRKVEALSKGMQQKLQFVCTLLHRPEFVILDEPFSGLDPLNVELLMTLMRELQQSGATVIFSTHQMETAERLCDRIVLINRGRKLTEGPLAEIRAQHAMRMLAFEGEGDFQPLSAAAGVISARVTSAGARLEIAAGADPNAFLRTALESARVTKFEIQRPDLHEIFVRLVQGDGRSETSGSPRSAAPTAVGVGVD
ncbi:putative ABC transporter ATP-binding protein YxlF [Phycisphaerae bacterium RAS1]|nr:putative ABC transporter ATP-binding protein YxlF [Phycisphaerae bacterium RAS1]